MTSSITYPLTRPLTYPLTVPLGAVVGQGSIKSRLPRFYAARQAVKAGTGRCRVGYIATSLGVGTGTGSGGTNDLNGAYPYSVPTLAAARVTAIPTIENGVFFDHSFPDAGVAALTNWDTRGETFAGTTWSRNSSTLGMAGRLLRNTHGTDTFSFTPVNNYTNFEIFYVRNSGLGTFTITDADGTLATIVSNGGTSIQKWTTTTRASSKKAVNIQQIAATADIYLHGIVGINAAAPSIEIYNLSRYGSAAADWIGNTNVWDPINSLPVLACDLWVIELGPNDQQLGVTGATFQSHLQTLITALLSTGDVVLQTPPPNGRSNQSLIADYDAARRALAAANSNVMVYDLPYWKGRTYAQGQSDGEFYDTVHLTAAGYSHSADGVAALLTAA